METQNLTTKLPKIKLVEKFYLDLPDSPGIYIYFKNGLPIYVGKAINLKRRVASYFRVDLEIKTKKMISEATKMSYIEVASELEALLLEAKLIKHYQPKYNIIAKDDKHPLYIEITKEQFPRIITIRKPDIGKIPSIATFGPFPSSTNVKFVLKMIRRIFPYSDHKIGKRACIYSQIGLCDPCPNTIISTEDARSKTKLTKKYKANIRHIKAILNGKIDKVKGDLEREMKNFSVKEDFEAALYVRNKIEKLEYIIRPRATIDSYLENPNLYEDIKNKELLELERILNSFSVKIGSVKRIECYDIAHLQGTNATASMVTFIDGDPAKEYYRHFRIRQVKGNDDYASMREVISRRKKHFSNWGSPDLIIVDGGRGQLSVFEDELKDTNIIVVGLAKRLETLVVPVEYLGSKTLQEYRLPRGGALNLVQRLRDEAHRFARVYHHKLFSKSLLKV